jgi:hypothetical protein
MTTWLKGVSTSRTASCLSSIARSMSAVVSGAINPALRLSPM